MTQEDIIAMAREAGWQEDMFGFGIWDSKELNVFAALVAAVENEACAKLVENYDDHDWGMLMQDECAEAIRARGNT